MSEYTPEQWTDFFVASAGASAALAGLVIVAVSVNVARIIEFPNLPPRAAATIGSLILILVCAVAGLIPQSAHALGVELLAFGVAGWVFIAWCAWHSFDHSRRGGRPWHESAIEISLGQLETIPFVVCGITLLAGAGGGLYWLAAGFVAVFVFSLANTWVLLIEILR